MEPGATFGVEEEFLVTDAWGSAIPSAFTLASVDRGAGRYSRELHSAQIESVSAVHRDAPSLRADLTDGRIRLAAASDHPILPVGWAPGTEADSAVVADARHRRIHARFGAVTAAYTACGVHVHVGVPDRDTGIEVLAHLRPWLPTLVALGVNSPFRDGRDTGYGSWRLIQQARFACAGVPPRFRSAAEYDTRVARLVDCGVLVDDAMSVWLARLSPKFPTVEVRAADVGLSVADSVFQAVVTRALVRTALVAVHAGVEGPDVDPDVLAAALWSAARYGLDGPGVDVVGEHRTAATELVATLVEGIADQLDETGDRRVVSEHLRYLRSAGTGARRLRAVGLAGVVQAFALSSLG